MYRMKAVNYKVLYSSLRQKRDVLGSITVLKNSHEQLYRLRTVTFCLNTIVGCGNEHVSIENTKDNK